MGKIKGLIGLAVIVGAFYVAWILIPPWFHNTQLQDDLDDIARRNSYTSMTEDDIKKIVITKAQDDEVKLKEDQIVITRTANGLAISVKYRVHVDIIVHEWDWDLAANSINKRI